MVSGWLELESLGQVPALLSSCPVLSIKESPSEKCPEATEGYKPLVPEGQQKPFATVGSEQEEITAPTPSACTRPCHCGLELSGRVEDTVSWWPRVSLQMAVVPWTLFS